MLRGLPAACVVWRPVYCAQIASLPQSGGGGPAFFVVDAFDGNTSGPVLAILVCSPSPASEAGIGCPHPLC